MMSAVSRDAFRDAMAQVCSPVCVITTRGEHGRGGFTATAMSSVTDDPPTLLVCMNSRSAQCDLFLENGQFCVNLLGENHVELAGHFAGKTSDMESRYETAEWVEMPSGNQALADATVAFDCVLDHAYRVGTHHILFGRVVGIRARSDGAALLYFNRSFRHMTAQMLVER